MAGGLMRRAVKKEILDAIGSVLRDQPEFKSKGEAMLLMNSRIRAIGEAIVQLLDNDWSMVIKTDPRPDGLTGRFGVDEPDPAGPARRPHGYVENGGV